MPIASGCRPGARALCENMVYRRTMKLTQERLGRAINPHAFRHAAATSIAFSDPEHVMMTKSILGHSTLAASERYYNLAQETGSSAAVSRASRDGAHTTAVENGPHQKHRAAVWCGSLVGASKNQSYASAARKCASLIARKNGSRELFVRTLIEKLSNAVEHLSNSPCAWKRGWLLMMTIIESATSDGTNRKHEDPEISKLSPEG